MGVGFVFLDPLLGLCPGPAGDLKRSPDPSPMHTPPNPKSWIRPWLQRRRIKKKLPIRNKNCLWWPCLLTDWNKMGNRYRGPSIDASYHVSVHLAKRFKRRIFFKSTNQKQELPVVVMFVNESGQYEHFV